MTARKNRYLFIQLNYRVFPSAFRKNVKMELTKPSRDLYATYVNRLQKIADIKYSAAVLEWDQETYLPPKGAQARSRQLASLAEIAHEWLIAPDLGDLLTELHQRGDLKEDQRRNVELSLEDYNKQKKFTPTFIRRLSETTSRSFHSWLQARNANSFALFKDDLQQLVELKRKRRSSPATKDIPTTPCWIISRRAALPRYS